MAAVKECISEIYKQYEQFPELAKFHRHLPLWFWMLSNKTYKIQQQVRKCNAQLGRNGVDITDYHLANLDQDHPEIDKEVECLEILVREYSADLLMASNVANLPSQPIDFARNLAVRPWLLGSTYPPTGENAAVYTEVPPGPDFCTLKGIDEQDPVTGFLTAHLDPMYRYAVRCIAYVQRRLGHRSEVTASERYVELKVVENCMHFAAALFVPFLLSCTLGALSALKSEANRIIVLGVFCLVLCWSLILVTPKLKRSEVFAIASAYFAVGGIYIGVKSD